MTKIERLSDDERAYIQGFRTPESTKALRIIDQLTAALEAAEERAARAEQLKDAYDGEAARLLGERDTLQARVAELEAERERLRAAESQYRERIDLEESKRCESEKLLRKTAGRLEALQFSANSACCMWERAPSASLHDIRTCMRTLRGVLSKPNLVRQSSAEAELETAEARVAELEAALAAARGCDPTRCPACYASPGQHYGWCKLAAAESELADLRGRVERAKAQLTLAFGSYVLSWPQGAVEALEALRGR